MQIDRIEGNIAVVELDSGKFINVSLANIEGRARDGACLVKSNTPDCYRVDEAATKDAKARIEGKMKDLFI